MMDAQAGRYEKAKAEQDGILKHADHGVCYAIRQTAKGHSTVIAWRGTANRPLFHYIVKSEDRAMELVNEAIRNSKASSDLKAQRKEQRKAGRKEMAEKIQVGTILSYSWGYDQTNVEFYQVVAKSGMTVTLREIAGEMTEATGSMSSMVKACPDNFIGEPIKKMISEYGVSMPHGICSPTTADREHYCSWYA